MPIKYPDYQNGIVNLACSILKHYEAEYKHQTLPVLDDLLIKNYKNVVVLLLDGLGVDALKYHLPKNSFLRRHYVTEISSVFPPTTTAATTSMESGLSPVEHGWIGWSLYFSEIDKIVNIFPNTVKFTKEAAADYHVAGRIIPYKSIYDRINQIGKAKAYDVSKFGAVKVSRFEESLEEIKRLCNQETRKYIYAYWENPDVLMHDHGCYDATVTSWLEDADKKLEQMCQELRDTLVIIIADHGHININYKFVSDYPDLQKMLKRPISIESRAACFYVKDEYRNQFAEEFYKAFGKDNFMLLTKQDVIDRELFGEGEMHPKFREFIGDFLAIAIADEGIATSHESRQYKSNHAGLTEQEMMVPFIAIER